MNQPGVPRSYNPEPHQYVHAQLALPIPILAHLGATEILKDHLAPSKAKFPPAGMCKGAQELMLPWLGALTQAEVLEEFSRSRCARH